MRITSTYFIQRHPTALLIYIRNLVPVAHEFSAPALSHVKKLRT